MQLPHVQPLPGSSQLHDFVRCAQDMLAIATLEGCFTYLSPRWCDELGYGLQELQGAQLLDFVDPADRERTRDAITRLADGREATLTFENQFWSKDARSRCLRWSCRVASSRDCLIMVAQDVTEARAEKDRYRSVVEASPIGLMTVDGDGVIVLANRELQRLFGYTIEEFIGMSVDQLLPERFRAPHADLRQRFLSEPSARMMGAGRDLFGRRKDGTEFLVEIGLNPHSSGDRVFVHCSIADVTERKRQEEELHARVAQLQRHRSEMGLLSEMSSLIQHAVSEREALDIVASFGEKLFPGVRAALYISSPSGEVLDLAVSWNGFSGSELLERSACWALRRSQPHRSTSDGVVYCSHMEVNGFAGSECIPMAAHGHLLGLLTLCYSETATPEEAYKIESVGKSVADQFGLALSNLQLRDKLRDLSIKDPLTGLFNRRYLEETVFRELHRAFRRRSNVSLLVIDVDNFKEFNDTFGHHTADEALREVAATVNNHIRGEDVVVRFGGEEFVVVLPEAGLADAMARAEDLRRQISEALGGRITVSMGVSAYPDHGNDWKTLFEVADAAMYRAKQEGRNRVSSGQYEVRAPARRR